MRIKVCGITRINDLQALVANGVDYAGFIFYEKSPRFAGNKIDARSVRETTRIRKVGVFVNASQEQVQRTVADYALDMVQLHGDETPEFCAALRNSIQVIKAFRIGDNVSWQTAVAPFIPVTDYFLFDTASVKGYGGTGDRFNWELLKTYPFDHPFFLSGGITPDQAGEISSMQLPMLFAADVNSKFEDSPGVKNIALVEQFVKEIHSSLTK
ncbi:phosphoribosylanthranilate isomerase [Chitinophaga polysaccharea]|uniref:phosphoribosylanthranilate isomerase n=1 Tax=Chitinophaga TaxID=79328 RepID=UPI001455AD0A|nr:MULTISPECIES: phosphoribosylanthranilate isomerase [Chitinophaga]NLR61141.1 phosphoribosylanthranilate isomerase [Chitinophaga polysaccharea]NLU94979.1 phosphoribosylanthranilate isomerase [Chitinophaga sp. Ak27]